MAAYLKKRDKCFIKLPEWLEPDNLQASLAEERDNPDRFSALPHHYVEIAKELLQIASDDLPEATRSLCHRPHASVPTHSSPLCHHRPTKSVGWSQTSRTCGEPSCRRASRLDGSTP